MILLGGERTDDIKTSFAFVFFKHSGRRTSLFCLQGSFSLVRCEQALHLGDIVKRWRARSTREETRKRGVKSLLLGAESLLLRSSFHIKNTIHCADSIMSVCYSITTCHSIMSVYLSIISSCHLIITSHQDSIMSSCHSIMSVCLSIMSSCHSITTFCH